jgi:DNA-binding transcriptional MerR regulator
VLTIGQLAHHTGVPAKTVRYYHSIGLLPEPTRDSSGYRRYTAADAIELIKVRALAEAGVPLAQIPALLAAAPSERAAAVDRIDASLREQVSRLEATRVRLRPLADPDPPLPPGVANYLELLRQIGMSQAWVAMEADLWILAFATHPESAAALLADQHQAKQDHLVQEVYREYDQARDLDPNDPRLKDLAERILRLSHERYTDHPPPTPPTDSAVPQLIQDMINSASPAWKRIDQHLRTGHGSVD